MPDGPSNVGATSPFTVNEIQNNKVKIGTTIIKGVTYNVYSISRKNGQFESGINKKEDKALIEQITNNANKITDLATLDQTLITDSAVFKINNNIISQDASLSGLTKAVSAVSLPAIEATAKATAQETEGPHPWTMESKLLSTKKQLYPKSLTQNDHTNFYTFVKSFNLWNEKNSHSKPYEVKYDDKNQPVFQSKEALIQAYCHYEEYVAQNQKSPETLTAKHFETELNDALNTGLFEYKEKKHKDNLAGLYASVENRDRFRSFGFDVSMDVGEGKKYEAKIRHEFLANSDLNGLSYEETDDSTGTTKTVTIENAFNSSFNRDAINAHIPRAIIDKKNNESICYAGRIKSQKNAEEIIPMMFEKELKGKQKGITTAGKNTYEFRFCVHSVLTTYQANEKKMLDEEWEALSRAKTIIYTNDSGQQITIKCMPIQINTGINVVQKAFDKAPSLGWIAKIWPGITSSKEASHNKEQIKHNLTPLINKKIKEFEEDPEKKFEFNLLTFLKPKIVELLTQKNGHKENSIIGSALLLNLLNLPTLIHCKSSVDRTAQTVAIYSAIHQWLEIQRGKSTDGFQTNAEKLGPRTKGFTKEMDKLFKSIQTDPIFNELFLVNWVGSQKIPSFARMDTGYRSEDALPGCLPKRLPRKKNLLGKAIQRILNAPESQSSEAITAAKTARAFLIAKQTDITLKAKGKELKALEKPKKKRVQKSLKKRRKNKKKSILLSSHQETPASA